MRVELTRGDVYEGIPISCRISSLIFFRCYRLGYLAHKAGQEKASCPYSGVDVNSRAHFNYWRDGWDTGDYEMGTLRAKV